MEKLENTFNRAAKMPAGDCDFPEPGRDLGQIEHPDTMKIVKESRLNGEETLRFRKSVQEMEKEKLITMEEAQKILSSTS